MYHPAFVYVIDGEAARLKSAGIGYVLGGDGAGVYDVAVGVGCVYVAIVYADKAADASSLAGADGYVCNLDLDVRDAGVYLAVVCADKAAD